MKNSESDTADDKSPWTQPGFIAAAAAVVALIVLLGLIVAFTGDSGGDDPGSAARPPAAVPPKSSASNPDDSVCGLNPGSQAVPIAAPHARWELVGRMVAPSSPDTVGPRIREHGIRSCFAHSPTGALYASVNLAATATDPARWESLARRLLADGPGRDRALQDIASEKADPAPSSVQIAGFSFRTFESDTAAVNLALRVDAGDTAFYARLPTTMKWEKGDWKFVVADNGDPFADLSRIPDLSGYTAWSGA